jgi:hypothetical protein
MVYVFVISMAASPNAKIVGATSVAQNSLELALFD